MYRYPGNHVDSGIVTVPRKLKTRPGAPETHLAYITPDEEKYFNNTNQAHHIEVLKKYLTMIHGHGIVLVHKQVEVLLILDQEVVGKVILIITIITIIVLLTVTIILGSMQLKLTKTLEQ